MRPAEPWKWPACVAVALMFLGFVFLLPRAWIFLLPGPGGARHDRFVERPGRWLVLQPPPEIEAAPLRPRFHPPPSAKDDAHVFRPADWWRSDVAVAITRNAGARGSGGDRPAAIDSLQTALDLLGVTPDLLTRARPDSILAERLNMLRIEEGFRFDELKPYLYALSRSEAYADIMSRSADMFGDFLDQEIRVTPRAERRGESP